MIIQGVTPSSPSGGDRWFVDDTQGCALPVRPSYAGMWRLLSISGGAPVTLAGEWDGEFFSPLAAVGAAFEDLSPRWAA